MSESARLFAGIGSRDRGDDGVGPWVAEALALRGRRAVAFGGDGAGLIALLEGERDVVLIDATRGAGPPGRHTVIDAGRQEVPRALFRCSTHQFGVAEAVETARALGILPPTLTLHGIEGRDFAPGARLSPEVARAARALVDALDR